MDTSTASAKESKTLSFEEFDAWWETYRQDCPDFAESVTDDQVNEYFHHVKSTMPGDIARHGLCQKLRIDRARLKCTHRKDRPCIPCIEAESHYEWPTGVVETEPVVGVAVVRKGQKVFVGDSDGHGLWIECESAAASRRAEELFREKLRAGYDGTSHELLQEVGRQVTQEANEHRATLGRKRRSAQ